jgi:hypothetical protein
VTKNISMLITQITGTQVLGWSARTGRRFERCLRNLISPEFICVPCACIGLGAD